ncbi:MAG: hypothetical protein LW605_09425 [Xanthomonadales bacterium]|nr:hypothetical protein [Xanthomonadales bacterium]
MPLHRHVHDFFVRFQDLVPHLDRGLEGHRRSLHRDRHIGERYILTAHIAAPGADEVEDTAMPRGCSAPASTGRTASRIERNCSKACCMATDWTVMRLLP